MSPPRNARLARVSPQEAKKLLGRPGEFLESFLVIVSYDVSTETAAGRKRLRRVARICESMGQRVQKSVFECRVDRARFEELERRLLGVIDQDEDCLRFYRLTEPAQLHMREYGKFKAVDFEGALVI